MTDIEIANSIKLKKINDVAKDFGISNDDLISYGDYKAKVNIKNFTDDKIKNNSKVILVSAMNPTPYGEGKTTVTIGLGDALNKLGKKTTICLREPSLGPVFGVKGGATGGGYSQVVPMEDINLHFTGDIHAIEGANNLLCAAIDNHMYQGNEFNIDPNKILIKRSVDMNDRSLRNIRIGIGDKNGVERNDSYNITVASEVMAIFCLSKNIFDLKEKLGNMLVAYSYEGKPIYAKDLKVNGAMAALLHDAINPNIVQTLEGNLAFVHGGPFANIAHGTNSIIATNYARSISDIVVTEAGFGSDLGGEKFFDITSRINNMNPNLVVLVATVRALKYNGEGEDLDALNRGLKNLERHILNMKKFNVPVCVALNKFANDSDEEINAVKKLCLDNLVGFEISTAYTDGSDGALELARLALDTIFADEETNKDRKINFIYDVNESIKTKIEKVAKEIYGADKVVYSLKAENDIHKLEELNLANLPICIAKTQMSFSDDPKKLGAPTNFEFNIREVEVKNGAGFIVALSNNIMTMPGLAKTSAYEKIDIDDKGNIIGLY